MPTRLDALTISEQATLREAMEAIDRGACEIALVVAGDGRLVGTLTDGDVRRAILGGARLEDQASRFAMRRFTAVSKAEGRADVLDLMRGRSIQQVPIVDAAGRLAGLHLLREIVGAEPRENAAVIMAGGRGERLRPLTDSIPKPMVQVAGRPILERIVLHLVGYGIRRIHLSVNYKGEVIERHFGDGAAFGCRIEYLREDRPLGTGGSLALLPEMPDRPLLVLNGDLLTQVDIGKLLAFQERGSYRAVVGVREYVHTVPFGVATLSGDRIVGLREKPTEIWHANAGIYVLEPDLVRRIPRGEVFAMPSLIEDCLDRGEPVGAFPIEEDWLDIGRHEELRRARGEE